MEAQVHSMVEDYERGRMTRRQLIARLSALAATATVAGPAVAAEAPSTFKGVGLNHIALRVTDVARSRDFYMQHLGMTIANESLPGNCFLNCGPDFVALFRGEQAGMDHYCYSIEGYDVNQAAEKLKVLGITPRVTSGRIYFPDPDGLTVQLAAPEHRA